MAKRNATGRAKTAATESRGGRERLMAAGMRLAARKRSLQAIGVRELGREAGLNPNTFYRHFQDIDDLSLSIIDELGRKLAAALRRIRRGVAGRHEAAERTVGYLFDFAERNPAVFIVAVREMHGASPRVREALRRMFDRIAADMAVDVQRMSLIPGVGEQAVRELSWLTVRQIFILTLDFLEQPTRRGEILRLATRFIELIAAGAVVLQTASAAARR